MAVLDLMYELDDIWLLCCLLPAFTGLFLNDSLYVQLKVSVDQLNWVVTWDQTDITLYDIFICTYCLQ